MSFWSNSLPISTPKWQISEENSLDKGCNRLFEALLDASLDAVVNYPNWWGGEGFSVGQWPALSLYSYPGWSMIFLQLSGVHNLLRQGHQLRRLDNLSFPPFSVNTVLLTYKDESYPALHTHPWTNVQINYVWIVSRIAGASAQISKWTCIKQD